MQSCAAPSLKAPYLNECLAAVVPSSQCCRQRILQFLSHLASESIGVQSTLAVGDTIGGRGGIGSEWIILGGCTVSKSGPGEPAVSLGSNEDSPRVKNVSGNTKREPGDLSPGCGTRESEISHAGLCCVFAEPHGPCSVSLFSSSGPLSAPVFFPRPLCQLLPPLPDKLGSILCGFLVPGSNLTRSPDLYCVATMTFQLDSPLQPRSITWRMDKLRWRDIPHRTWPLLHNFKAIQNKDRTRSCHRPPETG